MKAQLASLWAQAQRSLGVERLGDARTALEAMLRLDPDHADAHLLLSALAYGEGHLRAAAAHAVAACARPFDDTALLAKALGALLRTGEVAQAERSLRDPAVAHCRDGALLLRLANNEQMIGNHPRALALIDRAIAAGFDNPDVRYLRSVQLVFNGRKDDAAVELDRCLAAGATYGRASVTLARLRKQTREDNHVDFIRAQLRRVEPGSEHHAAFEFALYKELEDIGDYEEAWRALQRGNLVMHRRLRHDPAQERRLVDRLIERTASSQPAADDHADGPQPIFIVGMPRSGTTLLDRILGNHSAVTSAGELGDFSRQLHWVADDTGAQWMDAALLSALPRVPLGEVGERYLLQTRWRAGDSPRYVDKLPANYLLAGLIAHALPRARVLHLVRDPTDVCFSNYRAFFGGGYGYSYDLDALAQHFQDYRRLMAHWHRVAPGRILDVPYERLTRDSETMAREVFAFCDLPFEEGCLDLARNRAPVATLSAMQVGEGIRRDAFEEWRPYARHLKGLRAQLAMPPA
jgi:tetratricopeptide (TPR) repeat protein